MSAQPRISAVVTTYNHEPYLEASLQSVFAQTEPVEVVIAPDWSSDGTVALARALASGYAGRHTVVFLEPDRRYGLAGNYDRALRAASGDWVMICEGDDVSLPERASAIAEEAWRASEPASLVCSNYHLLGEARLHEAIADGSSWRLALDRSPEGLPHTVHGCTLAFPRRAYTAYGPLSPDLMTVDGILVRRAISLAPFVVVKRPEYLVRYRVYGGNTSGRFFPPPRGSGGYRGWLATLADHEVASESELAAIVDAVQGSPEPVRRWCRANLERTRRNVELTRAARANLVSGLAYSVTHLADPLVGGHCRAVLKDTLLSAFSRA